MSFIGQTTVSGASFLFDGAVHNDASAQPRVPSRRKRQPKGKGKGKEEKDVKDERDVAAMPVSPPNSPSPDPDNTNHENSTVEETKPDANDKASNRRLERTDKDASFLESFSPHTDWQARARGSLFLSSTTAWNVASLPSALPVDRLAGCQHPRCLLWHVAHDHKSFLASPTLLAQSALRPNHLVQHAKFVITYPRGYHASFNLAFNCGRVGQSRARQLARPREEASVCRCVDFSVPIDVDQLLEDRRIEALGRPTPPPFLWAFSSSFHVSTHPTALPHAALPHAKARPAAPPLRRPAKKRPSPAAWCSQSGWTSSTTSASCLASMGSCGGSGIWASCLSPRGNERSGTECAGPALRILKAIKKTEVEVLCAQHNPVIVTERRASKAEGLRTDILALPLLPRIKVFEVTHMRVHEELCSVEVVRDPHVFRVGAAPESPGLGPELGRVGSGWAHAKQRAGRWVVDNIKNHASGFTLSPILHLDDPMPLIDQLNLAVSAEDKALMDQNHHLTMVAPYLRIQEMWDDIIDWLHTSTVDLKSTSLVCRSFARRAQSHIFHQIVLSSSSTGRASAHLKDLMRSSPHLIPHVRVLYLPMANEETFVSVAQIRWSHLEALTMGLRQPGPGAVTLDSIDVLVSLQFLRILSFQGPFWEGGDLQRILARCTMGLERIVFLQCNPTSFTPNVPVGNVSPRPKISNLALTYSPWVVHLLPQNLRTFLYQHRATITDFHFLGADETMFELDLGLFPALTHIAIDDAGPEFNVMLARLPDHNRMQEFQAYALGRNMRALRTVEIKIMSMGDSIPSSSRQAEIVGIIERTSPLLHTKGLLSVRFE
ncbi:hypothetical protein B0H14DRAFT_3465480 [Mycena olivaceomarginata]|nr:hypothetical protein B0H14DRAFT_3465480 [Mycena olivaceomarginata]